MVQPKKCRVRSDRQVLLAVWVVQPGKKCRVRSDRQVLLAVWVVQPANLMSCQV